MGEPALKVESEGLEIRPQPGPQTDFLSTPADIAIFGGQAGGGKTYALLLEPLRHIHNPLFRAVTFRRTSPQITNAGALWDTADEVYPQLGAIPIRSKLDWEFPVGRKRGARVSFRHLEREDTKHDWQGAQVPFIGLDELTHFTEGQFWYMLSRNRSTCGVVPYMRATTNPDPDHFVRHLLDWWIGEDGYPLWDRSGIIRWFIRVSDEVIWGDTKEGLIKTYGPETDPKSFTFIPSTVYDNKILLEKDPGYLANLKALPLIDRERLLGGNWNIRESAGMFFKRHWFEIVDSYPQAGLQLIRYWDRAATQTLADSKADPSYTVGLLMGLDRTTGIIYIIDVIRFRETWGRVSNAIKNTASADTKKTIVGLEQDPGQAGKAEVGHHVKNLIGYHTVVNRVTENKGKRAKPLSSYAEQGFVKLVRGSWNEAFLREYENFDGTDKGHADQVDCGSGAFHLLTNKKRAGAWGR